jgi:hypothetical protein
MHWHLLVEKVWNPGVAEIAGKRIPKELTGQERIDFYKAREAAHALLKSLFPED